MNTVDSLLSSARRVDGRGLVAVALRVRGVYCVVVCVVVWLLSFVASFLLSSFFLLAAAAKAF